MSLDENEKKLFHTLPLRNDIVGCDIGKVSHAYIMKVTSSGVLLLRRGKDDRQKDIAILTKRKDMASTRKKMLSLMDTANL